MAFISDQEIFLDWNSKLRTRSSHGWLATYLKGIIIFSTMPLILLSKVAQCNLIYDISGFKQWCYITTVQQFKSSSILSLIIQSMSHVKDRDPFLSSLSLSHSMESSSCRWLGPGSLPSTNSV